MCSAYISRLIAISASVVAAGSMFAGAANAQPAAPIWTGLYVGAAAGYGTGEISNSLGGSDIDGVSGGGYAGYAFNAGPLVIGLEGSYNRNDAEVRGVDADAVSTDTVKFSFENTFMLRARVGVPVGPALLYATGGVSWASVDASISSVSTGGGGTFSASVSEWMTGYAVGGGVEVPIAKSMTLKGEVIYQGYDVELGSGPDKFKADYDTTLIQAGLSYYFN